MKSITKRCFSKNRILLLLILVFAGITRLYDMGNFPNGLHQDEAFVALNAFDLLAEGRDSGGHIWPVYMSSWGDGQSAMYTWLLLPILLFSGWKVNLWLIRLPQLIISLLTIVAVYVTGKELWHNEKAGLLGAALLAISPWHYMMSRWALDANMAPGFVCFALCFFVLGLKREKCLLLSALFYALSLYCYALAWLVVPVLLLLEIAYGIVSKKIKIDKCFIWSGVIFATVSTPIFLYFLVNQGKMDEIKLPFMTIYKSTGYRGAEVATTLSELINNAKRLVRLLIYADTGSLWNSIEPWGLFYPVGLVMMALGLIALLQNMIVKLRKKQSLILEVVLSIQLFAGFMLGLLVKPQYHQTNLLFVPLILLETYGLWFCMDFVRIILQKSLIKDKRSTYAKHILKTIQTGIGLCYAFLFASFLKDYFGEYRNLANAYFAEGVGESIEYALEVCEEKGIHMLTAEKATQWPRILLYTKTTPSQYFTDNLIYDTLPAPWSFTKGDLVIQTRIDYDAITEESVYIIYFTDYDVFCDNFELAQFADWYVAVPKDAT